MMKWRFRTSRGVGFAAIGGVAVLIFGAAALVSEAIDLSKISLGAFSSGLEATGTGVPRLPFDPDEHEGPRVLEGAQATQQITGKTPERIPVPGIVLLDDSDIKAPTPKRVASESEPVQGRGAQPFETSEHEHDAALSCLIEASAVSTLGSSVGGIVEKVNISRGDEIQAGQVLIELESDLEQLDVELARARAENKAPTGSAQARLSAARADYSRQQELFEREVTSAARLDAARAEAQQARHAFDDASTEAEISGIILQRVSAVAEMRKITSPFDGVAVTIDVDAGEYVDELTEVATIARINPLHVKVFAPVEMFGSIGADDQAVVTPDHPLSGSFMATVKSVDRVLDAASNTFAIILEMPNDDHAIPAGLRCKIDFATAGR